MDYNNYAHVNNATARSKFLEIIDESNLIDTFRELHSVTTRYTWTCLNPIK